MDFASSAYRKFENNMNSDGFILDLMVSVNLQKKSLIYEILVSSIIVHCEAVHWRNEKKLKQNLKK